MLAPFFSALAPLVQGRVHPAPAPPGTAPPYITVTVIGGDLGMALDGPDGSHAFSVQIDCWAATAAIAQALGWNAIHALTAANPGIGRIQQLPSGHEPESRLHRVSWEVQALCPVPTPP